MAGLKACTTSAQTPPGISLVQLAELPRILDPQLSPDGRSVAYMLSAPDWTANRPTYHLWRQDIGSAPVALTTGGGSETPSTIRWSPDGSSVLFGRAGQLMLIPRGGGTPRAVTKHGNNLSFGLPAYGPTWSPDGKTIFFTANDPQTPEERERERRRDDVFAYEHNYKQRHHLGASTSRRVRRRDHDRRSARREIPALSRRLAHRPRTHAVAARRRGAQRRSVGDGRRRRQRAADHA
jgi:dipeptidyl aminopeptidase/acylaminoacyl peptidase